MFSHPHDCRISPDSLSHMKVKQFIWSEIHFWKPEICSCACEEFVFYSPILSFYTFAQQFSTSIILKYHIFFHIPDQNKVFIFNTQNPTNSGGISTDITDITAVFYDLSSRKQNSQNISQIFNTTMKYLLC